MEKINVGITHELNCKDLPAIVERSVSLHKTGNYWIGPCPFCLDGDDRFTIKQCPDGEYVWFCRVCGDGKYHDVINYVMQFEKVGFRKAVEILSDGQIREISQAEIEQRRQNQLQQDAERRAKLESALAEYTTEEIWQVFSKRLNDEHRAWWRNQGIPDEWQDFWRLGYTPDRAFDYKDQLYHSPAYTIPKFDYTWSFRNMDYRLVTFPEKAGKYRPMPNLPPAAFISRPDMAQPAGRMIIVEGSKKAMVTTIYSGEDPDTAHVYGIPSKTSWAGVEKIAQNAEQVYIALDPDAMDWAYKLAAAIGKQARVVDLPFKPDDGFLLYGLNAKGWRELLKYSRLPEGATNK